MLIKEKFNKIKLKHIVLILLIFPILFGFITPPPAGTSYRSPLSGISDIRFIYDLSYLKNNALIHDQKILDEQIKLIQASDHFIVTDLFLYNDYYNTTKLTFPKSTLKLTNALISQKKKHPQMPIYLITDEINNSYSAAMQKQFTDLENNGITVIITDLNKVRDSNPLYSGYWRTYIKPFGLNGKGWLKNPFGTNGPDVNVRNYLKLLNFKANHRKVTITDKGAIITSSNPHDGSSYHSNIAFFITGDAVKYLLQAEKAVALFSGTEIKGAEYQNNGAPLRKNTQVSVLTENKIRDALISQIKNTKANDHIRLGMFYLAHREIIRELITASSRGVDIQIILDPNKDAFGFKKNGIPNRQTANELVTKSKGKIQVRWYDTHGEQYHSKIIGIESEGKMVIIGGSANYTRRNLDNYNLEETIMVVIDQNDPVANDFRTYFDRIWNNTDGIYTTDFSTYKDTALWKVLIYRLQEATGLCTF